MTNLEYPTLDLFIYNLREDLGEDEAGIREPYKDYWTKLLNLQGHFKNDKQPDNRIDFDKSLYNYATDGSYVRTNLGDTNCLRFSCSVDGKYTDSELEPIITKIKKSAILPEFATAITKTDERIDPLILSKEGFLGQTWMISGWVDSSTDINQDLAHKAYKSIIGKDYQYKEEGNFLGGKVLELWRGVQKWEAIENNSHVLIIFYPDEATFAKAAGYYNAWRYLFYCRHKILWAYAQGRELKSRLLNKFNQPFPNFSNLSQRSLKQLKNDLQTNINNLSSYVREINYLEIQQHTIEVNLLNYEKQREQFLNNEKFLQEFSKIATKKYKAQLEKDAVSLRPGVSILENVTNTIRGIVEIEQAERDRNFQVFVGLAGVGIGTASIAASTVSPFVEGITQQPFKKTDGTLSPKNAALFNITTSASISIGIGFLCILVALLAIWVFKRSRIVSQAKSHRQPPNK
ncbi:MULTISPECIES: hypothetical protein [Cyanophyceae]|uniref:hypothetical protein n=1 Tax=Cyanophyceae TaxID=3028117 RepID=UPI0016889714|nr:hypothetical protein [Trichocoleus sp. FACHB-40]MBD2006797.1 hypothetical protein [Trichocoleus sp. FACHB-40]